MLRLTYRGRPASDNGRHAAPGHRHTDAYKIFRDAMAYDFIRQSGGCRLVSPDVRMIVSLPRKSRIDRNNLIKATCDALQLAGVIDDDHELNYSHFHLEPVQEADGADAEITVVLTGGKPASK